VTTRPPPLDAVSLRTALESAGWRCTRQRQAVYDFLHRTEGHPSAEEIYQGVKGTVPQISLATVYKALEALEASGLATKLAGSDGSARFDAIGEPHYHLRCLRSGLVEDLTTPFDPDLPAKIDPDLAGRLAERGFHLTGYRLELVGYFDHLNSEPQRSETDSTADGSETIAATDSSRLHAESVESGVGHAE
jgi:Fur family transcriptional regulator, peroxide stress response regulator